MRADDEYEEDATSKLRQRLWGAAVLISIAVIVLPLILDGSGSESQFRRVEKLREEPPAIIDSEGNRSVQLLPETRSVGTLPDLSELVERFSEASPATTETEQTQATRLATPTDAGNAVSETNSVSQGPPPTVWVVKAGEVAEEMVAIELRDRLRQEGFSSFVKDRSASTEPFQVLVGPMIKKESAERERRRVASILQSDPVVTSYP